MAGTGAVPDLSLTEWVVLAVLAEAPTHGFAIAKELRSGTDLGRVITVHRPLVYRALDRLVSAGLVEQHGTEPSDTGPNRTIHRPTDPGRHALEGWLDRPVQHVRDLRIEFLIKLRLNQRRHRNPQPLIAAQRAELADTFDQLTRSRSEDVVDAWRNVNATAARLFLDHLASHGAP